MPGSTPKVGVAIAGITSRSQCLGEFGRKGLLDRSNTEIRSPVRAKAVLYEAIDLDDVCLLLIVCFLAILRVQFFPPAIQGNRLWSDSLFRLPNGLPLIL